MNFFKDYQIFTCISTTEFEDPVYLLYWTCIKSNWEKKSYVFLLAKTISLITLANSSPLPKNSLFEWLFAKKTILYDSFANKKSTWTFLLI